MIYLLLAICSSAMISIIMRLSTHRVQNNAAMLLINYLTCLVIAAVYTGGSLFPRTSLGQTLLMGGVHGSLYLVSFLLFQYNVAKSGVVLSSLFQRLGLLVPLAVSMVLFSEMPTAVQVAGFVLAIGAIVVMNSGRAGKVAPTLLLLLLGSGTADAMSKVFQQLGDSAMADQFLFYTFGAAMVLCLILVLMKKQRVGKSELLFGLLIGIPNFFSAKFLLGALNQLPGIIVYPTFSVATILVVMLAGWLLFKERLNRRQAVAAGVILVALVLLNL